MIGDILQPTHLLFILVVALLVLGPKRLPEVARSLGSGLRDFRSAISGEHHDEDTLDASRTFETSRGIEPTHPAEPAQTVAEPVHTVAEPAHTVAEPVHTVAEPVHTVAEPAHTVAEPPRTVAEPASAEEHGQFELYDESGQRAPDAEHSYTLAHEAQADEASHSDGPRAAAAESQPTQEPPPAGAVSEQGKGAPPDQA